MAEESKCNCLCFVEETMDVVSKKWALLVINTLGNHKVLRYNELMDELKGISPKSLADTLKTLCTQGLVQRKYMAEIPPKVQYSLTDDGKELWRAIEPLVQWALSRGGKTSHRCVTKYKNLKAHMLTKENEKECNS
ncbi:MAG: helix-turn-helix domain-containing protein [Candidatus Bathyarchaeia archaeon]|nr:helix-turn-helix transcriptional regulator [Candidatus Bathyarchaeota archaeon]